MATLTLTNTNTKYEGGTILVYQRDTDNVTDVAVSGTYTGGTPTHIEFSWKGSGYVTVSSELIAGGNWSGVLLAQNGDEGTLNLRWANDTATSVSTYFALGDYFLVIGDSIAVGAHVNGALSSATPKHTRYAFAPPTKWVEWDSTSAGPDGGSWPYLGTEITASQSVPCGFVVAASSGTNFGHWVHGQASTFDAAMTDVTTWGLTRVRGVLLHLGANNAKLSGNTAANAKTAIQQTCSDLNTYLPGGPAPIFWAPIGPVDSSAGTLRTEMDAVRQGLINAVAEGSCYFGPWLHDETYPDTLHPTITNAPEVGGRWWLAVADTLYGAVNGRGPRLTSLTTNGAKTTDVFAFDKTLANSVSSSTIGFRVKDDASALTNSSQTTSAPNAMTVVTSTGATGTITGSFGSGNDAIGSSAPKGATETLPSGASVQRVAEVFYDHALTPSSGISRSRMQLCM